MLPLASVLTLLSSKFFANPNGTKPAPQQSKLAFSSKSKDKPKKEEEEPVKAESAEDSKPKVEQDEDHDTVTADGAEARAEKTVKQETIEEVDEPKPKKALSKKVAFAESEKSDTKKRAAETQEEDGTASEEEPPTKKQRMPVQKAANPKKAPEAKSGKEETTASAKKGMKDVVKQKPDVDEDDEPILPKRGAAKGKPAKKAEPPAPAVVEDGDVDMENASESDPQSEAEGSEDSEDEKPEQAAKAREKVQSTLKSNTKDPYPDWKAGDPVPYAALCTTFSKIEMTTKRLEILAHCSLFLRQVLRLTPTDLLPTVLLMIGKLAADYSGIELGIGESLIMKSIGETTGRTLNVIKADQKEIGDLGLVAAKSKSTQKLMFAPKSLTVRGVHEGLMAIATIEGQGAQGRKVAGIKKLLAAADLDIAKSGKGVDITKDKGGPSEAKFIIRALEGKMRLGLADKTVLVALAQAMVFHEVTKTSNKIPSTDQLASGETVLKSVYRSVQQVTSTWVKLILAVSCLVTKSSCQHSSNMASSSCVSTSTSSQAYPSNPCWPSLPSPSQKCLTGLRAKTLRASTSTTANVLKSISSRTMQSNIWRRLFHRWARVRRESRMSSPETRKICRKSTRIFLPSFLRGSRKAQRVSCLTVRRLHGTCRRRKSCLSSNS